MLTGRTVLDKATEETIATTKSTSFVRRDGGFNGPPEPHRLPESKPQLHHDIKTLPQSALIYRLSGDYNPLHATPRWSTPRSPASRRPILHGLCSFGTSGTR